jgi:hypothetical protein
VEAAPANPERVAEAVEFVTEADLQLPDIYNMPFQRLPRHDFDYKLTSCVLLLAEVGKDLMANPRKAHAHFAALLRMARTVENSAAVTEGPLEISDGSDLGRRTFLEGAAV